MREDLGLLSASASHSRQDEHGDVDLDLSRTLSALR